MKLLSRLALATSLAAAMTFFANGADAKPPKPKPGVEARFSDLHMTATDSFTPEGAASYYNPILPGFYPDPSIVRVEDDYYLINSSFAFYPGIPVFHSKDLIHWQQIGNAIDRPGMLDFSGLNTSRGVFAPDISYHDGLFYIVNTCVDCKGNFVITAKDPKGPWSDPVWLPFGGIDPSIFWDDDGRAYIVWNDAPIGEPLYQGHRALWMQPFDPKTLSMTGQPQLVVNGGSDIAKKPVWIEGPHLYKDGGHYYLMAAEGGTESNHSEVVFRADAVTGPYLPYAGNPILTQRDLDKSRPHPVESTGHADIVQAADGQWWAVFLGTRPYAAPQPPRQGPFNTGRETFLLPFSWQTDKDGTKWPVILPQGQAVPRTVTVPGAETKAQSGVRIHDGYDGHDPAWLGVRTPAGSFVHGDHGTLILTARPEAIGDVKSHPVFIGLRQEQPNIDGTTALTWRPAADGDRAGIAAVQSDDFYLFFGRARRDGQDVIEVTRRAGADDLRDGVVVARLPAPADDRVTLHWVITGGKARFSYRSAKGDPEVVVADDVDVTNLSTEAAGGFVGAVIGPYAYGQTR
ncbi:MAG: family 43 glycosylhydrolase [Asticcacaulis sp.]|nr:family 43 glycosylhydrolase [Asticcacaulis sp.]